MRCRVWGGHGHTRRVLGSDPALGSPPMLLLLDRGAILDKILDNRLVGEGEHAIGEGLRLDQSQVRFVVSVSDALGDESVAPRLARRLRAGACGLMTHGPSDGAEIDYRGSVDGRQLPHRYWPPCPCWLMIVGAEDPVAAIRAMAARRCIVDAPRPWLSDDHVDSSVAGRSIGAKRVRRDVASGEYGGGCLELGYGRRQARLSRSIMASALAGPQVPAS
jgi:hypothetical protein